MVVIDAQPTLQQARSLSFSQVDRDLMRMNLSLGATMAFLAACTLAIPKNDTSKNKAVSSTPTPLPEPFSIVSVNLDPDMTLHQLQHDLSENGYRLRAESLTYGDSFIPD
jgi:hypothetical protein